MRHYSFPLLAIFISALSLGYSKAASADEVVVVRSDAPHHHYTHHDGYYWDGPHAYRRVWIAKEHRYDYRPAHVERHDVVVVHDDHDRH